MAVDFPSNPTLNQIFDSGTGKFYVWNGNSWTSLSSGSVGSQTGTGALVFATSPTLTGTPSAPTAAVDTNTTQIATTAYVVGQGYIKESQTITLSGDATGSGTTAITVAVVDDSHNHSNSTITSLGADKITSGTLSGDRGVTSGSTSSSFVEYSGTTNTTGQFNGGTTTPNGTTRLNYSGYFYPTFINLIGSDDTTTAATHYFVETGSDGFVRPKTLANVRTEIVTTSAVNSAAATTVGTITSGVWNGSSISTTYTDAKVTSVNGSTGAITGLAPLASPTFTGTVTAATLDLTTAATATAATSYWVETGSDGVLRPKTLENVRTEIVTNSAVNAAAATTVGTVTSGTWQATDIGLTHGGTNASLTAINGGVVYSTSAEMAITSAGTSGQVLTSNGAAAPTWQDPAGGLESVSATVTANDTATTLTTFSTATYSSAEMFVQQKQGTKMTTSKFLVMWDGTDVSITEFAIMDATAGAANTTITASHSGGTMSVTASSPDAATTNVIIKATVNYIAA